MYNQVIKEKKNQKTREIDIHWKPTKKQLKALEILEDNQTTELCFGGSAGPGKSYLGCVWLILNCLRYPGSRWLMGRAVLKALKDSTLLTFFEICTKWGLQRQVDYKYNPIEGVITFLQSGSTIYLKDLYAYPSDPEFNDLGSREFTGVFIDEASQITIKAYEIVKSRIRFKLDEFNLIPKILICSNPCKNFLYYDFYKPFKNNLLPKYKRFLPALVTDNPYISPHYIENLKKLKGIDKERLLFGNWEYDSDDSKLFEYNDILDIFGRGQIIGTNPFYLSVDVARFGSDKTVIILWSGLYVCKIWIYAKQSTMDTIRCIKQIQTKYRLSNQNIIIDEDGIGGALVDSEHLIGVKGFINNSRAIEKKIDNNPNSVYTLPPKHNFANLKTQCYFYLAKLVQEKAIGIYPGLNNEVKEMLIEELEQVKQKDIDKDGKIILVPKETIKETIGRSPDIADALMMRMYFEIKKPYKPQIASFSRLLNN